MRISLLILVSILQSLSALATNYYTNPVKGNDNNSGTSVNKPFKSLKKLNELKLQAGDKVFLAAGYTYNGTFIIDAAIGNQINPIIIQSYQAEENNSSNKATINAFNHSNGIWLINCNYIIIKNLHITANGGNEEHTHKEKKQMRCGIKVSTSKPGEYGNITLENLSISDIFYENRGFKRNPKEVKTANGTQNYGWGIRFFSNINGASLSNLIVQSCTINNVSHTGIKFTGKGKSINNIKIFNNQVLKTGGPGIQLSGVHNAHIKNNEVNNSGSNDDSRKWGRGSGLWTWSCSDVIVEHNSFKYANGPGDSAGCHIDYNCNNVIVQYNLSANNAGGFCEILGNNYNCAYRYNISVNDGYRVKGENGAFQEGKIFWLSGYQGNKKRSGPFNSYFYNNTIYVNKKIVTKIAIDKASSGILIANNIFCINGASKAVLGDQYKPEKQGKSQIRNIVFKNNLYLNKDNWPQEVLIQDQSPVIGNPHFCNPGGDKIIDYLPSNSALVKNKGIEIEPIPNDSIGLFIGLKADYDILGNKITKLPDLGAIEIEN